MFEILWRVLFVAGAAILFIGHVKSDKRRNT